VIRSWCCESGASDVGVGIGAAKAALLVARKDAAFAG